MTEITDKITGLDSSQPRLAVDLLWRIENDIQAAYLAQCSIMQIANPSLFAKTLESLRDKIYSEYNQVDGFNNLLTQYHKTHIPQLIANQVVDVKNKQLELNTVVEQNVAHIKAAEEYGNFNAKELISVTGYQQKVAEAENKLLAMQQALQAFSEFVEAKKPAGMKYSG